MHSGHGLSYSNFTFAGLSVEQNLQEGMKKSSCKSGDFKATVSFKITNTGSVDGAEVAQIYAKDPTGLATNVVRPWKRVGPNSLCVEQAYRPFPGNSQAFNKTSWWPLKRSTLPQGRRSPFLSTLALRTSPTLARDMGSHIARTCRSAMFPREHTSSPWEEAARRTLSGSTSTFVSSCISPLPLQARMVHVQAGEQEGKAAAELPTKIGTAIISSNLL